MNRRYQTCDSPAAFNPIFSRGGRLRRLDLVHARLPASSGTHLVNSQPPMLAPGEQLERVPEEGDGAGRCRHAPRGPVAVAPSGVQQRRRHQHRQQRPRDHGVPAMPRIIKTYDIYTLV